jgi:hypothetical protein
MVGGPGLRFALEAGFLIALAVVAGLAELSPTTIVLVMGAAWLLVAVIEWLAWREGPRVTHVVREEPAPAPAEPVVPASEPRSRRRFWRRREADEPAPEAAPDEPAPEAAPAGEDTQDLPPPEQQPAPVSVEDRTGT